MTNAALRGPPLAAGAGRSYLPLGAVLLVSLVAAAMTVKMPSLALLAVMATLTLALLRMWPLAVWALIYASSLLLDSFVRSTVVLDQRGMAIYIADVIPFVLVAGALATGIERPKFVGSARLAHSAGLVVVALIVIGFYRSVSAQGLTPALQARHLLPLVLAVTLPYSRGFANISTRAIIRTLTVAAVAIAIAAMLRLLSGYETTSALGAQRIYQTWEPFIAAGLFLVLLAFCLVGSKVSAYHYVGLGAAAIPVIFSFFRVAWFLSVALALLMVLFIRGQKGRAWIVIGLAAVAMTLLSVGAISSQTGPSYATQIAMRANDTHTPLDSYRAQEYGAVWHEIKKNPVLGSGFGTEYIGNWTLIRSWAHNAYEWMWWRLGFFGLVAFVAFVLGAAAAGLAASRRLEGDDRALAIGLTASLIFLIAAANYHENFENYQSNLVSGLLIAQILVLRSRAAASTGE